MTVPTKAEIDVLLARYGLRTLGVEPLPGGMENIHVKARTDGGIFVVTVLGKKDHRQAQQYARFLRHLADAGVPVPDLQCTVDGAAVTDFEQQPVIVCGYVAGTSSAAPAATVVRCIGFLLATAVHRPAPAGIGALTPHLRLTDADASTLDELAGTGLGRWARRTWEAVAYVANQRGTPVPIHADLFPDNIIVTSTGTVMIIDWEDGSLDLPAIDLGMALLGLCCTPEFSPGLAGALLAGYQDGAALPESGLLRDAARYAAVLVALRRHRWQREGHFMTDAARTADVCRRAEQSLNRAWPRLSQHLPALSGPSLPELLHHRKD